MCGLSAVAIAGVDSALRRSISSLASMPSTHFSASRWLADVRMRIDSNRLRAITGTRTFSSNAPCVPATVIAVSLPITCAATWSTTSGMTGLTLPGMIDEPFWSSGSCSSTEPGARARAHQHQVVGDLGQRHGHDLERAVQLDQRVAVGLRLEAVARRLAEAQLLAHALGELGVRVEARAGGGPAERDLGGARRARRARGRGRA